MQSSVGCLLSLWRTVEWQPNFQDHIQFEGCLQVEVVSRLVNSMKLRNGFGFEHKCTEETFHRTVNITNVNI